MACGRYLFLLLVLLAGCRAGRVAFRFAPGPAYLAADSVRHRPGALPAAGRAAAAAVTAPAPLGTARLAPTPQRQARPRPAWHWQPAKRGLHQPAMPRLRALPRWATPPKSQHTFRSSGKDNFGIIVLAFLGLAASLLVGGWQFGAYLGGVLGIAVRIVATLYSIICVFAPAATHGWKDDFNVLVLAGALVLVLGLLALFKLWVGFLTLPGTPLLVVAVGLVAMLWGWLGDI